MSILKKSWLIYIVCLHVLVAIILFKSNFIEIVENKLGFSQNHEISEYYNEITNYHKRLDASIPSNATIFIGDSITQGLATSAVSDLSVNYGIGSDTTLGVLQRLPMYKSINTAKAVVIAIAVNDLPIRNNDKIIYNYKKILDYIPQSTKVVVSAVLPIDEKIRSFSSSNKRISKLNASLKKLTVNYDNVVFIDSSSLLQDNDSNLKNEFHTGDGIHLSTAGYKIWINQLKEALKSK